MIYRCEVKNKIISFEVKGINNHTIDNLDRQTRLLEQGLRQKKYLSEHYPDYTIDNVYCFVTGKNIEMLDIGNYWNDIHTYYDSSYESYLSDIYERIKETSSYKFIKKLFDNGFHIAFGETPQQCAKKAMILMNLLK